METLFPKGTIALVTGGSSGIGKACAIDLAKNGAYVIVNYNGNKDGAQDTLNTILANGGSGAIVKANVGNGEEVDAMFAKIKKNFGHLDVLVNNAGIIRDSYILMMSRDAFTDVVSTNLGGCFNCSQAALRLMVAAKKGSIVNISSTSGITGSEGQSNYSASKAGIIALTKTLAVEYVSKNIRINAVAPGFIVTNMTKHSMSSHLGSATTQEKTESLGDKFLNSIPMKRFGNPEEVAHAVTFLASDLASYITGKTLAVDGGLTY